MSVSFGVPRVGCKHNDFLESQSGLGLQLHSAYQEILLGSHEEDEAGACLILPQHVLQPLPGVHRGETRDLHVARRNRDGTLTYTDLAGTDAGAGVRGPPWDQKELELQRHWFGRGEDSYCETWGTPVVIC